MFEAKLTQGSLLKKLVDAIKELCSEINLDISPAGIAMQAMDSSHVCLIAFNLVEGGFAFYRCDRPLTLGINLANLAKILKCAGNDDIITLKAEDEGDLLTLMFESESQDRVSDFQLKLMSIDAEQLGIPEQEFAAEAKLSSTEYARIMRDLTSIGDTVSISATKEGIKFTTTGDVGTANITLRHSMAVDRKEKKDKKDKEEPTEIVLNEPVALTFSLRYLNNFSKAAPLSPCVKLSLAKDLPVVVEYSIQDMGSIKFYLAPKIDDEDAMAEQD